MSRLGPEEPQVDQPRSARRPVAFIRCPVRQTLFGFEAVGRIRIGKETLDISGTGSTSIEALQAALATAEKVLPRKQAPELTQHNLESGRPAPHAPEESL